MIINDIYDLGLSENVVYPIVPNGFADHYPVMKNGYFIGNIPNIFRSKPIPRLHIDTIQKTNLRVGRLPHAMDDAAGQLSTTASTAPRSPGAPSWGESQGCPKVWSHTVKRVVKQ